MVLLVGLLAACTPAAVPETPVPVTGAATHVARPEPTSGPTPTSLATMATATTATATTPATAGPAPTPLPPVDTDNLFAVLLGEWTAPAGWSLEPCEGDGDFLCVVQGEASVGAVQFSVYPIETLPDFKRALAAAGLGPGPLDWREKEDAERVLTALGTFVEDYHTSLEADRQVEYGDNIRYRRLETQDVSVGALPGLQYGFAGVWADGTVHERWVSYIAFDGDLLYVLVAPYRGDAIPTFRTDEDLQRFLPHLTALIAELALPLPVLPVDVQAVQAQRDLPIFRTYADPGNPAGQIAAGETVTVTGVSLNRRHWRVACPGGAGIRCWLAATDGATQPAP